MTALLERALDYAARGWCVFPVEPRAKRPLGSLVPKGLHDATTSPEAIERWWSRCPTANVAIATGAVSRLVVVDVDGDQGCESLRDLQRRWGALPPTLWARTGSGGWHCYLAHPGIEVRNSTSRLGPGLDVRGDGGYVLAPPSIHPCGAPYAWHDPEVEPQAMPRWLLSALDPPRRVSPWRALHDRAPAGAQLEALVRFVSSQPIGNRNSALYWAARRALEEGHAPDQVAAHLLDAARACGFDPSFTEPDAARTIRSAMARTCR